ncbi:hypothetical protein XELAEV_18040542mg [Xenopus laevis]|uniref:Uncharacterized protein n=1 Tax=Xenopus laevis TaxID=8355 RepID=A0A974CAR7_XENLA|nr:hypothetical protein XELAEV_18040542mg [Xenopus laevis]
MHSRLQCAHISEFQPPKHRPAMLAICAGDIWRKDYYSIMEVYRVTNPSYVLKRNRQWVSVLKGLAISRQVYPGFIRLMVQLLDSCTYHKRLALFLWVYPGTIRLMATPLGLCT